MDTQSSLFPQYLNFLINNLYPKNILTNLCLVILVRVGLFFHVLKVTAWLFSHRFLKVTLLYIVLCYLHWKVGHLIIEAWIFVFYLKFIFPSRTFTLMTTLSEITIEYFFLFICTYYFNICALVFICFWYVSCKQHRLEFYYLYSN